MRLPRHVLRLLVVIALLGLCGLGSQQYLKPATFGEIGNYRAESLSEIMVREPVHQGKSSCEECHADIYELHEKDIHYGVQCEDCHGPARNHVLHHSGEDATIPAEMAVLSKEYTLEGCLFCHRKLVARPPSFPQIDPLEHFAFLKVKDPTTRCTECHSPHEPIYLLKRVEEARIHPIIHQCKECHNSKPEGDSKDVKGHPVIFTCRDCHPAIVEDFMKHEHAFMECTSCHLFHYENENAGRIFKNGNGKFCLLCHEKKPFKDEATLPQIDSANHLAEMAKDAGTDFTTLMEDPRACIDCHFDFIHDSSLMKEEKKADAG